jgi:hypothetical protein
MSQPHAMDLFVAEDTSGIGTAAKSDGSKDVDLQVISMWSLSTSRVVRRIMSAIEALRIWSAKSCRAFVFL